MSKKFLCVILSMMIIALFLQNVTAENIDYSRYLGKWKDKNTTSEYTEFVGLDITYCNENTMDFVLNYYEGGYTIYGAQVSGSTVYCDYSEFYDYGSPDLNYTESGQIVLTLLDDEIHVQINPDQEESSYFVMIRNGYNNYSHNDTRINETTGTITVHSNMNIEVNGQMVNFPDAHPFIDEAGRTQVPVRFIAEQIGYEVVWAKDSIEILPNGILTFWNGEWIERILFLNINSYKITITDSNAYSTWDRYMDTVAMIKDDRAYIPLRYIAELLGYTVIWQS